MQATISAEEAPTAHQLCVWCLLDGAAGCEVCVREASRQLADAERSRKRANGKRKRTRKPRAAPADACDACGRLPGDSGVARCLSCPPDAAVVARRCIRCQKRPSRCSMGVCRACYNEMSRDERASLPRTRHGKPAGGFLDDEGVDPFRVRADGTTPRGAWRLILDPSPDGYGTLRMELPPALLQDVETPHTMPGVTRWHAAR